MFSEEENINLDCPDGFNSYLYDIRKNQEVRVLASVQPGSESHRKYWGRVFATCLGESSPFLHYVGFHTMYYGEVGSHNHLNLLSTQSKYKKSVDGYLRGSYRGDSNLKADFFSVRLRLIGLNRHAVHENFITVT